MIPNSFRNSHHFEIDPDFRHFISYLFGATRWTPTDRDFQLEIVLHPIMLVKTNVIYLKMSCMRPFTIMPIIFSFSFFLPLLFFKPNFGDSTNRALSFRLRSHCVPKTNQAIFHVHNWSRVRMGLSIQFLFVAPSVSAATISNHMPPCNERWSHWNGHKRNGLVTASVSAIARQTTTSLKHVTLLQNPKPIYYSGEVTFW